MDQLAQVTALNPSRASDGYDRFNFSACEACWLRLGVGVA